MPERTFGSRAGKREDGLRELVGVGVPAVTILEGSKCPIMGHCSIPGNCVFHIA
jgi:hypothetical protein